MFAPVTPAKGAFDRYPYMAEAIDPEPVAAPRENRSIARPKWEARADRMIAASRAAAIDWAKRCYLSEGGMAMMQYECGRLQANIGTLCNRLDEFEPVRNPDLDYIDVTFDAIGATVCVACDEYGVLIECWLHGADIAALLTDDHVAQLTAAVGDAVNLASDEANIDRYTNAQEAS